MDTSESEGYSNLKLGASRSLIGVGNPEARAVRHRAHTSRRVRQVRDGHWIRRTRQTHLGDAPSDPRLIEGVEDSRAQLNASLAQPNRACNRQIQRADEAALQINPTSRAQT